MAVVSAPGKILWIGGYSVLERPNVSFVTGVDKRVFAHVEPAEDGKLFIDSPQFGAQWTGPVGTGDAVPPQLAFVHRAATTSMEYLAFKGIHASGVRVKTLSDPAFGAAGGKSGLGSSAAVTVAVVGGVFEAHGKPVKDNAHAIHKIAQYTHSAVQGKVGSGFDVAASCFGGCAYSRYSPEKIKGVGEKPSIQSLAALFDSGWDYSATPIGLPPGFLVAFGNFAGQSTSTSVMVKYVNEWKAGHAGEYASLMKEIDGANRAAVRSLEKINELAQRADYEKALDSNGKHPAFEEFKHAFTRGRELTKQLGDSAGVEIESDACTKLIEATENAGAFAVKLPGAGGGDAIAALCLSLPSKKKTEVFWQAYAGKKVEPVSLGVSNAGVQREEPAAWKAMESTVR